MLPREVSRKRDDNYLTNESFDVGAVYQCPAPDLVPSQESLIEEAVDCALGNPQVVTCFLDSYDRSEFPVVFNGLHCHVAPIRVIRPDMDLSTRTEL